MTNKIRTTIDTTLGVVSKNVEDGTEGLAISAPLTASSGLSVTGGGLDVSVGTINFATPITASKGMLVYGNNTDFRNPTTASSGLQVKAATNNLGFAPYAVQAATSLATAPIAAVPSGSAGVFLLGVPGATTAVTAHMPPAATYPGSIYTFRSITVGAHVISGSDHVWLGSPAKIFCDGAAGVSGSTITLPAASGSCVILLCDGINYQVIGKSGSLTIS